jgi:outer membrane immunogenic protein
LIHSWTGCHFGLQAGGVWGHSQHIQNDPAHPNGFGLAFTDVFAVDGIILGTAFGCDHQAGVWIIGGEADLSWLNAKATAPSVPPFIPFTLGTNQKWLNTERLRLGVAGSDRVAVYGTGGLALTGEGEDSCNPAGTACGAHSKIVLGWTVGVGAQYELAKHWSMTFEYLFADFGKTHFPEVHAQGWVFYSKDVKLTDNIFRIGLNYK